MLRELINTRKLELYHKSETECLLELELTIINCLLAISEEQKKKLCALTAASAISNEQMKQKKFDFLLHMLVLHQIFAKTGTNKALFIFRNPSSKRNAGHAKGSLSEPVLLTIFSVISFRNV